MTESIFKKIAIIYRLAIIIAFVVIIRIAYLQFIHSEDEKDVKIALLNIGALTHCDDMGCINFE